VIKWIALLLLSSSPAACCSKPAPKPSDTGLEVASLRYEGSPGNVAIAELTEDLD
jgi:hypothetical protein